MWSQKTGAVKTAPVRFFFSMAAVAAAAMVTAVVAFPMVVMLSMVVALYIGIIGEIARQ